jgi:hypothetical protein
MQFVLKETEQRPVSAFQNTSVTHMLHVDLNAPQILNVHQTKLAEIRSVLIHALDFVVSMQNAG